MLKFRLAVILLWLFMPIIVVSGLYINDNNKAYLGNNAPLKMDLEGLDINANHVRDDIEITLQGLRWQGQKYQLAFNYAEKLQHYMAMQTSNLNALKSASKAHSCAAMQMHTAFNKNGSADAYDAVMGVYNIVLNIEVRQKAYRDNELKLDAADFRHVDSADCGIV